MQYRTYQQNNETIKTASTVIEKHGQCSDEYGIAVAAIALSLTSAQREVLGQLVNGPVWDGDVCSKDARSDLMEMHLATKICVKGEQGYNAATYRGFNVWKALGEGEKDSGLQPANTEKGEAR